MNEVANLLVLIQKFSSWTGQNVNWSESIIHFSQRRYFKSFVKGLSGGHRAGLCGMLKMLECNHKQIYL